MTASITAVAIAAGVVILVAILIRRGRIFGAWIARSLYNVSRACERLCCAILDDLEKPWRWTKEGKVEIITSTSRRYLAALGAFYSVMATFGVLTSVLGFGVVGSMILTIMPGALVGAWAYRRVLHW